MLTTPPCCEYPDARLYRTVSSLEPGYARKRVPPSNVAIGGHPVKTVIHVGHHTPFCCEYPMPECTGLCLFRSLAPRVSAFPDMCGGEKSR